MLPFPFPHLALQASIHHTTFAARLSTLLHPLPLSSAATVPLILVPNGSFLLFNNTHALSSKRTTRPSGRCSSFFVRTTTACRTSPRRILVAVLEEEVLRGMGRAFLITTTISSPVKGGGGAEGRAGRRRANVSSSCGGTDDFPLALELARDSPTVARPLDVGFRSTLTHSATSPPELSMIWENQERVKEAVLSVILLHWRSGSRGQG